jgi:hypothetical protein
VYLPEFLFEEDDIPVIKNNGIFQAETVDRKTGIKYYHTSPRKFKELIDLLYSNDLLEKEDKSDIEFNMKIVSDIFTSIINNEDKLSIIQAIISYFLISKSNAKALMDCVRRE